VGAAASTVSPTYGGNLTYGEVTSRSVADDIFERAIRGLRSNDVFCDFGSGTGKIPILAAIMYPGTRTVGIEYSAARHKLAVQARAALSSLTAAAIVKLAAAARVSLARESAALVVRELQEAMPRVTLICGDFLHAKILTATTVAFVNNTVFEASLMNDLTRELAKLQLLRKLVVIKQLCPRHRSSCLGDCSFFAHPPKQLECVPSWDARVSLYAYDVVPKVQPPPPTSAVDVLAAIGLPMSKGRPSAFTAEEEAALLVHWERSASLGAMAARYQAIALAMGCDVERVRRKLLKMRCREPTAAGSRTQERA
jgi:precorrin-6B methylase 2